MFRFFPVPVLSDLYVVSFWFLRFVSFPMSFLVGAGRGVNEYGIRTVSVNECMHE